MTEAQAKLMNRAGALLSDAAGMLQLEAQEWRDRKSSVPRSWQGGISEWAARCERIAETNTRAATSMNETAKRIVETMIEKAA